MPIHGLDPEPVDRVHTCGDLRELALRVKDVRFALVAAEAERALRVGEIPARSRVVLRAVLCRTLEDIQSVVARHLECDAAGPNVIPLAMPSPRRPAYRPPGLSGVGPLTPAPFCSSDQSARKSKTTRAAPAQHVAGGSSDDRRTPR